MGQLFPTAYISTPVTQEIIFESSYKPATPAISGKVTFIEAKNTPTKTQATPLPQNKAFPANPQELEEWFDQYSALYGVSKETLKSISRCESNFNPAARNGNYVGLFQFASSTWVANRKAMGLDTNPDLRLNGEESIKTAAFKIARDGTSAWKACVR